jgi:polyhydroxyalkanoate synthesis repressor PhaR
MKNETKQEILIKKYSNRRLYNTEESCYVKLDDIANIIREGFDIKVIDTSTKEDITKQILAQIIMEEEKNKNDILPMSLFYKIIRSNEEFISDFFENYLNSTLDSYLAYRQAMEDKIKEMQDISKLPYEMGEVFMKSLGIMGGMNPLISGKNKNNNQ